MAALNPFSRLPAELRDLIISMVLLEPQEAPKTVADIQGREKTRGTDGPAGTYYEPRLFSSDALRLLLVSRDFRHSTLAAIEHLRKRPVTYSLDLMFEDNTLLWPTWTHVPFVTRHIHRINLRVRLVGKHWYPGWSRPLKHGTPPSERRSINIASQFYSLLEHCCQCGAGGHGATIKDEKLWPSIELFNIDFVDGAGAEVDQAANPRARVDAEEAQAACAARTILKYLESLLRSGHPMTRLPVRCIGRCTFSVNGEVLKELRLEDYFPPGFVQHMQRDADISANDERVRYPQWQYATWRGRKERGLPTGNLPEEEQED